LILLHFPILKIIMWKNYFPMHNGESTAAEEQRRLKASREEPNAYGFFTASRKIWQIYCNNT
jgi:hypothetical protein